MILLNKRRIRGLGIALLTLLSACADVSYVKHARPGAKDTAGEDASSLSRTVDYHLSTAFYTSPPRCVMILPVSGKTLADRDTAELIEAAVSRHASSRFDTTITSRHVKVASRKGAFDPAHAGDRARLARAFHCDTQMQIGAVHIDNLYAVVWADRSVAIQLTLTRSSDGTVLWNGQHTARRADGGLPISILGIGAGTFSAGRLASDADVLPSMIDDTVRRVMTSLPDTRRYGLKNIPDPFITPVSTETRDLRQPSERTTE
jgi:hypothetical protein